MRSARTLERVQRVFPVARVLLLLDCEGGRTMRKLVPWVGALALVLAGCPEQRPGEPESRGGDLFERTAGTEPVGDRGAQAGQAITPVDQSNDPRDVELTRRIRQALVDDDSLSTSAHNVKVITRDGSVTLRGEVETESEKSAVRSIAEQAAGAGRVTDQIQVAREDAPEEE
jgi:hypothetical protein